jgi:hypothetical protein
MQVLLASRRQAAARAACRFVGLPEPAWEAAASVRADFNLTRLARVRMDSGGGADVALEIRPSSGPAST